MSAAGSEPAMPGPAATSEPVATPGRAAITARAPGKLFVAGEYAVVEPGHPSVLVAVDRFLSVTVTAAGGVGGSIRSSQTGEGAIGYGRTDAGDLAADDDRASTHVLAALRVLDELVTARAGAATERFVDLVIESELDDASGRKFGLGSSAAVTVAVIDAVGAFYGLGLATLDRLKLALLATVEIAPRASGGDLAASAFGGWVAYSAPDREAVRALRRERGVAAALEAAWPGLSVRRLPTPSTFDLAVGWTGAPASTALLVDELHTRVGGDPSGYTRFLAESDAAVEALVDAIEHDDAAAAGVALRSARGALLQLGERFGLPIETGELTTLCTIAEGDGCAAKPSGAGGGDCGVALVPTAGEGRAALEGAWEAAGIRALGVRVVGGGRFRDAASPGGSVAPQPASTSPVEEARDEGAAVSKPTPTNDTVHEHRETP